MKKTPTVCWLVGHQWEPTTTGRYCPTCHREDSGDPTQRRVGPLMWVAVCIPIAIFLYEVIVATSGELRWAWLMALCMAAVFGFLCVATMTLMNHQAQEVLRARKEARQLRERLAQYEEAERN